MFLYLAILAFGGGLFWDAIKQHRRVRQIEDTPRSKTASAPQGLVELQGFAWPEGPTYRLDGEREVVYYLREIQFARPAFLFYGRSSRWKTVSKKEHTTPFFLVDDAGIVRVDPRDSESFFQVTTTKYWKDLSEQKKAELKNEFTAPIPVLSHLFGLFRGAVKTSMVSPLFFFAIFFYIYDKYLLSLIPHYPPFPKDKQYRVRESWIDVGSPIYVSGSFQTLQVEQTSASQKGIALFYKNISESSFEVLSESAKVMGFDEFKNDYTLLAQQARMEAGAVPEPSLPIYGQVKKAESHVLFLGDGFESVLKDKLKAWLHVRFVAGAAIMAIAVSMGTLKYSQTVSPRAVASTAPSKLPNSAQLHQQCVNGQRHACGDLVKNRTEYQLPEANVQYYKNRFEKLAPAH